MTATSRRKPVISTRRPEPTPIDVARDAVLAAFGRATSDLSAKQRAQVRDEVFETLEGLREEDADETELAILRAGYP